MSAQGRAGQKPPLQRWEDCTISTQPPVFPEPPAALAPVSQPVRLAPVALPWPAQGHLLPLARACWTAGPSAPALGHHGRKG